jgi:hypothetical protein
VQTTGATKCVRRLRQRRFRRRSRRRRGFIAGALKHYASCDDWHCCLVDM